MHNSLLIILICTPILTVAGLEQTQLGQGVRGYWTFDQTLNDQSSQGVDGSSTTTITYTNGAVGDALHIDNASHKIQLNGGEIEPPWTLSAWIKRTSTGQEKETLLHASEHALNLSTINTNTASNRIHVERFSDGMGDMKVEVPTEEWAHVAFVATTKTMSVFVNGKAYGMLPNSHPYQTIPLPLDTLGARSGTLGIMASIDEMAAWDRTLHSSEILHLYQGGLDQKTIPTIASETDEQSLAIEGPGINQETFSSVGQRLASFDLNGPGQSGEEGRTTSVGYRNGWFYADSRNISGSGGLAIYDFSDFSDPKRVSHFYHSDRPEHLFFETIDPAHNQHYYQNNTFVNSPLSWDLTQLPSLLIETNLAYTISRSPDVQAFMVPPYAYYGQYGYPRSHKPMEIWDMRTNERIVDDLDFENDLGFRGVPTVIGNLMIITASNRGDGVATYDVSDPTNPILLDVLYGVGNAYEPTVYGNQIVMPGHFADGQSGVSLIDYSDPSNLQLVHQFEVQGSEQYANFQDNYMFLATTKVNMNTYQTVKKFYKGNQYLMPIGNVVLIISGKGSAAFFSHQLDPDTNGPYVNHHLPQDGAINQALTTRVGIVIPETLRTDTINDTTFIVQEVGGNQIDGTYTYTDKGIINFTPRVALNPNTSYRVILPQGGIEDIVGNGMENELSFTFSTGSSIVVDPNNAPPEVIGLTLSAPSPLPLNTPISITAHATDPDEEALEYQWKIDDTTSAWTSTNTYLYTFPNTKRYPIMLRVRDAVGNYTQNVYTLTAGTPTIAPRPEKSETIRFHPSTHTIWTVNPDNDTVTEIDPISHQVIQEIAAGDNPSGLAIDAQGRIWVTCRNSNEINIIQNGIVSSLPLMYGDAPLAIAYSPANDRIYVTTDGSGLLLAINPQTQVITKTLELEWTARAIAITGDGSRALVTKFITEGEDAKVWDIDLTSFTINNTIILTKHNAGRLLRRWTRYLQLPLRHLHYPR